MSTRVWAGCHAVERARISPCEGAQMTSAEHSFDTIAARLERQLDELSSSKGILEESLGPRLARRSVSVSGRNRIH